MSNLIENQDFGSKKNSNLDETSDLDQIKGAEFEFLGPETRFERNKRNEFWKTDFEISNSI